QEIRPVGADHNVRVDVRIVAATNRDLREDVRKGRFREDLYFRLHVLQVKLPALRERPEDFDDLLKHFADPLRVRFTLPALMRLREHPWPGNIRELKNFALRASATYPSTPIGEHEVEQLLEPPTLAPDSPPQNFHPV